MCTIFYPRSAKMEKIAPDEIFCAGKLLKVDRVGVSTYTFWCLYNSSQLMNNKLKI